jgi:hypothetical protein
MHGCLEGKERELGMVQDVTIPPTGVMHGCLEGKERELGMVQDVTIPQEDLLNASGPCSCCP